MSGDNERSDLDPIDLERKSATGAAPDKPISLLDDDGDDDDNFRLPLETRTTTTRTTARRISKNRYRPQRGDDNEVTISKKKARLRTKEAVTVTELSTARNNNKDNNGCMLNPRNPIKIFATDRDKAVRRRLRRSLASQSTTDSVKQEKEYNHHWSTFHCWTFREMLGFDRFSGLRKQEEQQEEPALVPNAVGIDWIFVATYILDVDFLLNELPELINVPIVIIVYQYKDSSPSGREENWAKTASSKGHSLQFLVRNPRAPPGTATNPLETTMDYGCHHTKMTLVGYSSGRLRVHIHTSNLRREDVHDKCQGAFLQDFLPKTEDQLANFVTSPFEESLVTYLESYQFLEPLVWTKWDSGGTSGEAETLVSHIQTHDFSKAVGVLVPSVPGYHKNTRIIDRGNNGDNESSGEDKIYGYLKVKQAIRDHCGKKSANNNKNRRSSSIVCQFSSMGSLSKPYLNKIADAWNTDAVMAVADIASSSSSPTLRKKMSSSSSSSLSLLKIVWPTVEEIVMSVEGIQGGASVPGRTKNLHKDFLRPLLYKWRPRSSNPNDDSDDDQLLIDKGNHVPHIKSYYQMISNGDKKISNGGSGASSRSNSTAATTTSDTTPNDILWFVLSSHNLSKAAWGEIQNRMDPRGGGHTREILVIQHWELGVFVSPSTLGVEAMGPLSKREANTSSNTPGYERSRAIIPLPYKIRPDKYQDSDRPWVVE